MRPTRSGDCAWGACNRALAALGILAIAVAGPLPLRAEGAAASEPRATIALSETYTALRALDTHRRPIDEPQTLAGVTLPFRSVVEGLLRHAGIEVPRDPSPEAGVTIIIECEGTTRGQLYDASVQSQRIRELRYTDARVTGWIRIAAADRIAERGFAGEVALAVSIIGIVDGHDPRRDAIYAPFHEAFEAPGGFLDALGDAAREIWGEMPLRAALDDRDPLVREVARRALDKAP